MTDLQTIRLSYTELSTQLGISLEAAKQRARRGGWRRETGNDGQVYAWVPEEALTVPARTQKDVVATEPPHSHDVAAITALTEALKDATERANAAEKVARESIREIGDVTTRAALAETRATDAEKEVQRLRLAYEKSGLAGRIIRFLSG